MRVRWLRTALRNLDDEANYIATDDPAVASLAVERVLQAVAMLEEQPGIGRPGRVHGTRELIVPKTRYLVPYPGGHPNSPTHGHLKFPHPDRASMRR